MAAFALGRPTPDYSLLQTGFSKKPKQLELSMHQNRDCKKHIIASSPPQESIKPARQQIPINDLLEQGSN